MRAYCSGSTREVGRASSFLVGPGRRLVVMVLFIQKTWDVSKALKAPPVDKEKDFQEEGTTRADVWRRESVGYLQSCPGTITSSARCSMNHQGKQLGKIFAPWGQLKSMHFLP